MHQFARPTYRQRRRESSGSTERLVLIVALLAGALVAWTSVRQIGVDLTLLGRAATSLGLIATQRAPHLVASRSSTRQSAAAEAAAPPVVSASQAVAAAPYCAAGEAPGFQQGFAALRQSVGAAMGEAAECAHADPSSGDTVQRTTTGLAYYRPSTNTPAFTDGWRHWALVGDALRAWEGTESDPPAAGHP